VDHSSIVTFSPLTLVFFYPDVIKSILKVRQKSFDKKPGQHLPVAECLQETALLFPQHTGSNSRRSVNCTGPSVSPHLCQHPCKNLTPLRYEPNLGVRPFERVLKRVKIHIQISPSRLFFLCWSTCFLVVLFVSCTNRAPKNSR
jgi:hypothetical protein